MTKFNDLNEIESRILAVLEEAGEEGLCSLMNTVIRRTGKESDVLVVGDALVSLQQRDYVEFAMFRMDTITSMSMYPEKAKRMLSELPRHIYWSKEKLYWQWDSEEEYPEVLITPSGLSIAHELLEKYGWKLAEEVGE